jgi:hypothetical protein
MPRLLKADARNLRLAPGYFGARARLNAVLVAAFALLVALAGPGTLAHAAGDGPTTAAAPEGLGLLILLIGLAAVGFVAMTLIGRTMPVRAAADFDDDELIQDEDNLQ